MKFNEVLNKLELGNYMKIPLFKIYNDKDDINNISEEISSGGYWAVGPKIEEFEEKIAEYIGSEYAVTLNSGTSALHATLLAYGIGKGDEVIVPSYTFIASANAPIYVGAKPVFADIEQETYGIDPESVLEKITDKTKAIMPVHYGGCPSKVGELKEIAEDNDLILIEDAAESFGASIGNKNTGTFGDSAILSFCQNKIITTGEGGAVVTDSKDLYEKIKLIKSHGRLESGDYFSSANLFDYIDLGYNWRMSNLTSALGLAQLKKVDEIIKLRRQHSNYLNKKLGELSDQIKIFNPPKDYNHVYQLYTMFVNNRDELIDYLSENGITTKVYFDPVHLSSFYKNKLGYTDKLPVTEEVAKTTITLPMFPELTTEELDYMVETIGKFYEGA